MSARTEWDAWHSAYRNPNSLLSERFGAPMHASPLRTPGRSWTRHRRGSDLTPRILDWFSEHDFAEEHFVAPGHAIYSVVVHRFLGDPEPLDMDQRLFTFNK